MGIKWMRFYFELVSIVTSIHIMSKIPSGFVFAVPESEYSGEQE